MWNKKLVLYSIIENKNGNKINVAIGRLYGASRKKVAEGVSKALNCRLYDRQIICLMAEKFGMDSYSMKDIETYFDSYNEQQEITFSPYAYGNAGTAGDLTASDMFKVQTKIIRELSVKSPGVFLGRCANFILESKPHTYSFFLYADDEYRKKEAEEYYKEESLKDLDKRDEQRNNYYQKFTGVKRDDPQYYDMVINVGKVGVENAVNMILDYIKQKEME